METDVDAYFAQHDIPSFVSDMLFELGFHRPKDVGKFIATFVDRRFHLDGVTGGKAKARGNQTVDVPVDEEFSTIEVRMAPTTTGNDESLACSLLEEVRALRRKYRDFQPRTLQSGEVASAENATSFAMIPWSEFRADYERVLVVFGSQQLWAFCEKRLAQLRGLFDVHQSLNGEREEAEEAAAAPPPARVDNCVQVARALAPGRLLDLFRRSAYGEGAGNAEVAPGRTLADLASQLGRSPGPTDLVCDADAPVPGASSLCGVFSRTSNHARGQFLAEVALTSFGLLEATDAASGGATYAEYRLPLHPESGAWGDLARWAEEFKVRSQRVQWVVQLPQAAYAGLKERRSVLSFGELLENAFGPPTAAATEPDSAADDKAPQLLQLLHDVCAFELAAAPGGAEALGPEADREPFEWASPVGPPYVYQLYHVWARLKALNACRASASLPAFALRGSASSAEPLACAYLLGAGGASRCGALPAHAPLQYLFALDEVEVAVSLTSRRSLGGAGAAGAQAFAQLFKAGIKIALCTEDPTVSQQCDGAIGLEYGLARSALGLSRADLAEIAQNSAASATFAELRSASGTGEKGDEGGGAGKDGASGAGAGAGSEGGNGAARPLSIRGRYRRGRRDAELALLARLAPHARAGGGGGTASPRSGPGAVP